MLRSLVITVALFGSTVPAFRCDPPPRNCDGHIPLLDAFGPSSGWDSARMSRIMWRESRCDANAYNARGHAVGLLQITPVSYPYLRAALGEWVDRWTLTDPVQNIRAGAALFDYWTSAGRDGYQPWRL
jgi:hypothetical protein